MIEFDNYAGMYDAWFMENENVLMSEFKLVAEALGSNPGRTLSVGCGSGLFEMLLKRECGVEVTDGIEPSRAMAEIAEKRGMTVRIGGAEDIEFGDCEYDTVLFNGTPSYITDLELAFDKTYKALKPGGRIIAIDVPKESSYGLMYNLAKALDTWEHPLLTGVAPLDPYPIEFCRLANWRTTAEKIDLLHKAGFIDMTFSQTLTRHPMYTNTAVEEPIEGFDRGDYVAVTAVKPM